MMFPSAMIAAISGLLNRQQQQDETMLTGDGFAGTARLAKGVEQAAREPKQPEIMPQGTLLTGYGSVLEVQRALRSFFNPQPMEGPGEGAYGETVGIGAPRRAAYGGGRL